MNRYQTLSTVKSIHPLLFLQDNENQKAADQVTKSQHKKNFVANDIAYIKRKYMTGN